MVVNFSVALEISLIYFCQETEANLYGIDARYYVQGCPGKRHNF